MPPRPMARTLKRGKTLLLHRLRKHALRVMQPVVHVEPFPHNATHSYLAEVLACGHYGHVLGILPGLPPPPEALEAFLASRQSTQTGRPRRRVCLRCSDEAHDNARTPAPYAGGWRTKTRTR